MSSRGSYNEHKQRFYAIKKDNENDYLEQLKYTEQQNSERNQKVSLMRFDEQIEEKEFKLF